VATAAAMRSTAAAPMITTLDARLMFSATIVARVAYVPLAVMGFVCIEVLERFGAVRRHRSDIAVARIITVVYVTIKAVRTVKPGPGANEQAACEPVWPIVPVRRTVIRGIVKIAIGTHRRYADVDGNLGGRYGRAA